MSKHQRKDKIAELARAEHEDREYARKRIKELRHHAKPPGIPRSLRARRSAGKSIPEEESTP
jgi:hypothetical protein